MTQNCIRWWGSCSGDLENEEFLFITITPKSTPLTIVLVVLSGPLPKLEIIGLKRIFVFFFSFWKSLNSRTIER